MCLIVFGAGVGASFIRFNAPNEGTYTGVVYEVKDNYYLLNTTGERLYVYDKDNNKEIGDVLKISGYKQKISFSKLESSFDFENYLNRKGVYNELVAVKVNVKFSSPLKLHFLKKAFLSNFDTNTKSIVSSILFSETGEGEVINSVRDLHLAKFLSANGTYIYLVISLLTYFLNKLFSKKWSELSAFGITLIYLIFIFPRLTALRICFLFLLRWLNRYKFNGKFDYFTILSFSGIIFLLLDPYLALQDSFIIGYSVPMVFYLTRQVVMRRGRVRKFIIPSISIYLFFIPFELRFYNSLCPLSPILQLLLTPLFISIGLLSLICFFKVPLYGVVSWLVNILNGTTSILKFINIEIYAPSMNPLIAMVYYSIFILLLLYYETLFYPFLKPIFISFMSLIILYVIPIKNLVTNEVSFINVGQGDSCLIRSKNTTVLIDTGGLTYKDLARESLVPFFKKNRIYDIDLVITTHEDYDHSGALYSLSKNFKIKNYVSNFESFPIKIGNFTLNNYNNHINDVSDENDKSLVIGFELAKKNYLIMGDAPISIEKKIMEEYKSIPCDILKVGHHGSDTSSSYEFLKYLSPKEAVISCGLNNKYGHPHKSVIESLKKLNIKIRRTDYSGTISYKNYIFNE